jgi:hypothetical protein
MQKIWMLSVATATLLSAQEMSAESITEQLENEKIAAPTKSGFMPDISLIVDVGYTKESLDFDDEHLEIPGLVHGGGDMHEGHSHTQLAGNDGFDLNYAELSIGASVDNYFDLMSVFHITEDDIEIEEAYATTTNLPYHLKAKIGKFKSDFGYLNVKHAHNYNFVESPLIYQALLGDHGINEKGIQLQYIIPSSVYMMVGVEMLRGENEQSFGTEGFLDVEDVSQPSLWLGYLKTSFDIADGTLLAGVSMAQGESRIDHLEDEEGPHAFAGDTTLYGIDFVYKKYFSADNAITWQNEYIYRELDGSQYKIDNSSILFNKKQAGFYTELVYQHNKHYRAGLRYSAITQNDVVANGMDKDMTDDIAVTSAMIEYNFSEYSRLRLQYNHNGSLYNEDGVKNNKDEILLQFNYSIGAHGAHSF